MKKEGNNGGSICGGVISQSKFDSNPWAYMMMMYMPDKQFKKYVELIKDGKDKEAAKFSEKHARSAI